MAIFLCVDNRYFLVKGAFPMLVSFVASHFSKICISFLKTSKRALSKVISWLFGFCEVAGTICATCLMVFYIVLSMTYSDQGLAQSFAEAAAPKPKPLPEKQAISVGNKEPIGSFRISSPFGWRIDPMTGLWAQHQGVDIAGKRGSPILAPAKGQVCLATYQANLGNLLEIDHGNGYVSRYGHLDRFAVKEGDWVREGEQIASLGRTGRASGPHLHYELRYRGKLVNPAIYPISVFEDKGQGATSSVSLCRSTVDHRRNNTRLTEPPKQFIKNDALKNRDIPRMISQGDRDAYIITLDHMSHPPLR
jgi:hypothetical protein